MGSWPEGEHGGVRRSIGRETQTLNDTEKLLWGAKKQIKQSDTFV
jgi:hypothetical protein